MEEILANDPPESWKSRANASTISNSRKRTIVEEIAIMMASWHMREREEHRIFVRSLEMLFATYPPSVTAAVTSPLTGIQCRLEFAKYPPNHAQIRGELEREMALFERNALRHRDLRITREAPDERPRMTLEEMREKYPEFLKPRINGDHQSDLLGNKKPAVFRSLAEIMAENGVTQAQVDAMPDLKRAAL